MSDNQKDIGMTTGIPAWRYVVIILASFIIMLCAGSVYAWSVFVKPLKSEYGLTTTDTQIIFGFIIALLAISNCFIGRIERRFGPQKTAVAGAVFFSLGYIIASLSQGSIIILIVGLGLINGIGMALAYITIISTVNKWLPRNKGLATGIAMSGFGGGAVLVSNIAQPLLNGGMGVLEVYRLLGIILGAIYLVCALFLANPPWESKERTSQVFQFSYADIFRDRRYWVLAATTFCAALAPLLFYGNLKPLGISLGISEWAATLGITLMSVGNLIGRLTWGQINDMIGSRKSILISIFSVVVMTLVMWAFMRTDAAFIVMVLVFGFCFGADFTLYASNVGSIWGVQKIGTIYPLVFLAYGMSAIVGPILGGKFFDATGSYLIAMLIGAVICFLAFIIYFTGMPERAAEKGALEAAGAVNRIKGASE
ncbi:MAG: MFS transporter [Dehalococcoidales bacterium]|nr:MFS transporter [Dehalococcoidales bacterium]